VAFCGEENDPNYNIMKISKDPMKHSIVQRGKVAARQLVEGIAIEEVATRCTLSQELVLQVLVKTVFEQQSQLAEQLAVVQRLYQMLVDQLRNGVVYPTSMFQVDHLLFRRQPIDDPRPNKQRKPKRSPSQPGEGPVRPTSDH
jgi:DNA-binding FadR family transcriptional regulator